MKEFEDDLDSQLPLLFGDRQVSRREEPDVDDESQLKAGTTLVKQNSTRMVHFSFHFCHDVKVSDLQKLSREISQASDQILVTLDFCNCGFGDGALDALCALLHENSQACQKRNRNLPNDPTGARICGFFFTGRNMGFPQSLPLLLECTSQEQLGIEEVSFNLRHGNILTSIRKSCTHEPDTDYHRVRTSSYPTSDVFFDGVPLPHGSCALEVCISCANFGVSEHAHIDFVRDLCNSVLLPPQPHNEQLVAPRIQSLSVGPISICNDSLALLSSAVQASVSLQKFSLCIQGGLTSSPTVSSAMNGCAVLGQLLRNVPAPLQEIELLLSDCPSLFTSESDSTMLAKDLFHTMHQHQREQKDFLISILGLENVGLTESGFVALLREQKVASVATNTKAHPHHHLWLTGEGFFGERAYHQLVDSLAQMNHLETLSIVDQRPLYPFQLDTEDDQSDEDESQVEDEGEGNDESETQKDADKQRIFEQKSNGTLLNALRKNTSLLYTNMDVGWLLLPVGAHQNDEERDDSEDVSREIVDSLCSCWRRNELLAYTKSALGQSRTNTASGSEDVNCSLGLMPFMIERLLNTDEHVGIDAAHVVVRNIFLEQISWRRRIEEHLERD